MVESAIQKPTSWIIADQVWFELYRLLRNPAVLKNPLTSGTAIAAVDWYRQKSGWLHCAWETDFMDQAKPWLQQASFPLCRTYDLTLAITLKSNGVRQFYTHNAKDFADFGFFDLVDPVVSTSQSAAGQ